MDWSKLKTAEINLIRNFLPIAADMFLGRSTEFIATFYSSMIGEDYYVTGIGIASQISMCTINAFIFCYGTVFECYAGATLKTNGKKALGTLMYKVMLQSLVAYAIALGPFLCLSLVIPLFGDDEEVHKVAADYLMMMALRPFFLILRDTFIKYLVVQGYWFISVTLTLFCGVPTIILLGWLFVVQLEWGMAGLAAAQYALVIITLTFLALFTFCKREQLELKTPSKELFSNWGQMFKLGILAGFRGLATYAVSAFAIVLCQESGPVTAEAFTILTRVLVPFTATAPALAYAQAIQLGNSLGKKDKDAVKYSLRLGAVNLVIDRIIMTTTMVCLVPVITNCLTSIPSVIDEVIQARSIVAVMLILRGVDEFLARGVLTPLAKQALIAITSLMSVYLVSVPLMTWLVYAYQVNAFWIFFTIVLGCLIQSIVYIARITCFLDIETEIEKSAERMALNCSSTSENSEISGEIYSFPDIGTLDSDPQGGKVGINSIITNSETANNT